MDIGVVITALNHAGTIIESTESVLSQSTLPDQLGLSLGPSFDGTDRMAEFYREEYDFIHFDGQPDAGRCGLMHLRLGSLSEVNTDYVLFLNGDSYLSRGTVQKLHQTVDGDGDDVCVGRADFLPRSGESWSSPLPVNSNTESLLDCGLLPSGVILWPRERLVEMYSDFQGMKVGPFAQILWLLELVRGGTDLHFLNEILIETWDLRLGESCYTTATFESMINFLGYVHEKSYSTHASNRLEGTIETLIRRQNPPVQFDADVSSDVEPYSWCEDPLTFTE
jgi:glycosyltransferase involved in cell wall biosynthesis